MILTKRSELSGNIHSRSIPIEMDKFVEWMDEDPVTRPYVQDAFPELDANDREFILTGITPEEWDTLTDCDEDTEVEEWFA